jgi:MFS family permease
MRAMPWVVANAALNNFFAIITFGSSVFVLYMNDLGLPKASIGALLSFFPFCGVIAPFLASWAARVGVKRVNILFYGARKFVILGLLFAPVVLAHSTPAVTFGYVAAIILIFALCRAVAETAAYPWYQEFVPNDVRGQVAAVTYLGTSIVGALALALCSYVLAHGHGIGRYGLLIGIASVVGIISVLMMFFIPGGAPVPEADGGTHTAEMRAALRDTHFLRYLFGISAAAVGMTVANFVPLYLREQVGIRTSQVVLLDIGAMVGGFLCSYLWGWLSDRRGGRIVSIWTVIGMAVLPVAWLALVPRHAAGSLPVALGLAVLWGAFSIGYGIASTRLLFTRIITDENKTAYTAVWYAWIGVVGGLGPLLAGRALDLLRNLHGTVLGLPVDPYTPVFLACAVLLAGAVAFFVRVAEDG